MDDDEDIREALAETLGDWGFSVLTAANGRDALALLRTLPVLPSVILLDLMMPVMDGYAFLEARRSSPALASIPFAIINAGYGVDRDRLGEAPPLVPKPIKLPHLLGVVRDLQLRGASP